MSTIIGAPKEAEFHLNLVCQRGHVWDSKIVGFNWDGAVFENRFCPECMLSGKRVPITADDVANLITEDDVRQVGEDAMPVFAYVLSRLFEIPASEERRYTLSVRNLCESVMDISGRVLKAIERLKHFKYLKVEEHVLSQTLQKTERPTNPLDRRFAFELGEKVSLIRAAEDFPRIITV